jgi:hypothetical protein
MQLQEYLDYIQPDYDFITYEIYCEMINVIMIDPLSEGVIDDIKKMNLSRELIRIFNDLKNNLITISKDFSVGIPELISSFKQKNIFNIFKAFKFNFSLMFRAIRELTKFIKGGLLAVFRELHKTKAIQKVRSGALKIDAVLAKHPILKKVTGVVIAGLLLYIWLNMTFIGDLDYDFNFSDTAAALAGSFSIADLFVSPEGLMLITLFGSGAALGLSIPWLGKATYNLVLAIIYTAYYKIKHDDKKYKEMINSFKSKLKKEKLK